MNHPAGTTTSFDSATAYPVLRYARVTPETNLAVLSQHEVNALCEHHQGELESLFRRCALAVLSSGLEVDDARDRLGRFSDFEVRLVQEDRGICVELEHAPAAAFVGDEMIRGVRELLFAVLRDLLYTNQQLGTLRGLDLVSSAGITDVVFRILRNAGVLERQLRRPMVVCWGGHAISRAEYDYTKAVGYALGLRGLDVCTGCGSGAMKGPMKGATIAHAKQRVANGRYIGITEPGIIAAEAPNPIVNALVIMPDIEKRLEAFLRLGHGMIVFPGGVGTAEELLYLLGVLAHPDNAAQSLPVILTGPAQSADYFAALDDFIRFTLGPASADRYQILIDDPNGVAAALAEGGARVLEERADNNDAPSFNWRLNIDTPFQTPFPASHAAMNSLALNREQPVHQLACALRQAFSGIVSGNVKEAGINAVEQLGPFQLRGEPSLMRALDELLRRFVEQGRMRLSTDAYQPCYEIIE